MLRKHYFYQFLRLYKTQIVVTTLLLLATFASILATQISFDNRSLAAPTRLGTITIQPPELPLPTNQNINIPIYLTLNQSLESGGLQFEFFVKGVDPQNATLHTNQLLQNTQGIKHNNGTNYQVAYLPLEPNKPFYLPDGQQILIGRLEIKTGSSGAININFNQAKSYLFAHRSDTNHLNPPATVDFPVGTQAANTSARIDRLVVIDTSTNQEVKTLAQGDQINLADTPKFTIRAQSSGDTNSVRFQTQGIDHTESSAPYSMTGNVLHTYNSWDVSPGTYQITVTPYSRNNAQGEVGTPIALTFQVINQQIATPNLETINLIDADSDRVIQSLGNQATISLNSAGSFNIDAIANSATQSVRFTINGQSRLENVPAYAMYGNNDNDFESWYPDPGTYQIIITPFSQDNAAGIEGGSRTITLTFTNDPVTNSGFTTTQSTTNSGSRSSTAATQSTNFILTRANSSSDIRPLNQTDSVSLSTIGDFNIRLNNAPSGTKSVRFTYSGYQRIENIAPYALSGDTNGTFEKWWINPGSYQITATAYDGSRASGRSLRTETITLTVTN